MQYLCRATPQLQNGTLFVEIEALWMILCIFNCKKAWQHGALYLSTKCIFCLDLLIHSIFKGRNQPSRTFSSKPIMIYTPNYIKIPNLPTVSVCEKIILISHQVLKLSLFRIKHSLVEEIVKFFKKCWLCRHKQCPALPDLLTLDELQNHLYCPEFNKQDIILKLRTLCTQK